jgi:hypothetical protein
MAPPASFLLSALACAALASAAAAEQVAFASPLHPPARRRLAGGGKAYGSPTIGEAVLGESMHGKVKTFKRAPAVLNVDGESVVAIKSKHVSGITYDMGIPFFAVKGKYSPRYAAALESTGGEAVLVKKG